MPKPSVLPPNVQANTPPVPPVGSNPTPGEPSGGAAPTILNTPAVPTRNESFEWPLQPNWATINARHNAFLWSALIAKYAYTTNTEALNAIKALIGNPTIEVVTQLGQCPAGLKVIYPGHTVFVIQGPTSVPQNRVFTLSGEMKGHVMNQASGPTHEGFLESTFASSQSYRQNFLGYMMSAIAGWAYLWTVTVGAAINASALNKGNKIWLVGHSLGASICEYMALWASWEDQENNVKPAVSTGFAGNLIPANWDEYFGGAFLLGAPAMYGYNHFHRNYTGDPNAPTEREREKPYLKAAAPFRKYSRKVWRFYHPLDPARFIFRLNKPAPWWMWNINSSWSLPLANPSGLYDVCPPATRVSTEVDDELPNGVISALNSHAECVQALDRYHNPDAYLSVLYSRLESALGQAPTAWFNAKEAALGLTPISYLAPTLA